MHEFRKKKLIRRILYSPFTIAALFVIAILMFRSAINVHGKAVASREAFDRSSREFAKISGEEANLANSISYLSTPAGVETEIRKKFRVVKPGESLAVILDDAPSSTATTTLDQRGFWEKMWGWLGF